MAKIFKPTDTAAQKLQQPRNKKDRQNEKEEVGHLFYSLMYNVFVNPKRSIELN
jgi:hypothetical protein